MKNSELVEKYRDKLIEEGMGLYKKHPAYQVDMYLYPDGTIDTFTNVGGTSWLDDDHITVFSINHEHMDVDDEEREREQYGEWDEEIREAIETLIDNGIEQMEWEEKASDLYDECHN